LRFFVPWFFHNWWFLVIIDDLLNNSANGQPKKCEGENWYFHQSCWDTHYQINVLKWWHKIESHHRLSPSKNTIAMSTIGWEICSVFLS
jgi:hypothetical protein